MDLSSHHHKRHHHNHHCPHPPCCIAYWGKGEERTCSKCFPEHEYCASVEGCVKRDGNLPLCRTGEVDPLGGYGAHHHHHKKHRHHHHHPPHPSLPCIASCARCYPWGQCYECAPGYTLSDGDCVKVQPRPQPTPTPHPQPTGGDACKTWCAFTPGQQVLIGERGGYDPNQMATITSTYSVPGHGSQASQCQGYVGGAMVYCVDGIEQNGARWMWATG